jgi:diguanylate cyclase (GGDEF)-like protein
MPTLLVVDAAPATLAVIRSVSAAEGLALREAPDGDGARAALDGVDVVVAAATPRVQEALDLVRAIERERPGLPVMLVASPTTHATALTALQLGAFEVLRDPFTPEAFREKLRLGLALGRRGGDLAGQNEELRRLTEALAEANRRLAETNAALETRNRELATLAVTDPLTSLGNRRRFMDRLMEEAAEARRYGHPLSVVFLDLDHFKWVNDTYGHPIGDEVLKEVARLLKERARETDVVARIGGEEFAVLLPSTDTAGAALLAESFRARIAENDFSVVPSQTVSVGVAQYRPDADDEHASRLLAAADKALYEAKTSGRNRIAIAAPSVARPAP